MSEYAEMSGAPTTPPIARSSAAERMRLHPLSGRLSIALHGQDALCRSGCGISYHSRVMTKHFCETDFMARPRPASAP